MCIENGEDKQNEHQQRVSSLAFSLVSIAPTVFINVLLANNISNLFEILSFALNVLSSSVECKREKIFLAQGRHITTYTHTHTQTSPSVNQCWWWKWVCPRRRCLFSTDQQQSSYRWWWWWWWKWEITPVTWSYRRKSFFLLLLLMSVDFWQDDIGKKPVHLRENNLFAK